MVEQYLNKDRRMERLEFNVKTNFHKRICNDNRIEFDINKIPNKQDADWTYVIMIES